MELFELGRLVRSVDQACRVVIERPHEAPTRDVLFEALAPVTAPSFLDDRRQSAALPGLNGTHERQAVISDLLQHLDREKDV